MNPGQLVNYSPDWTSCSLHLRRGPKTFEDDGSVSLIAEVSDARPMLVLASTEVVGNGAGWVCLLTCDAVIGWTTRQEDLRVL